MKAKAYVVGSSALYYWRRIQNADALKSAMITKLPNDCCTLPSDLAKHELEYMGFGKKPIHLMVPKEEYRVSRAFYEYNIFPGTLPKDAFRKLNDHVYIASPELCIIQAAAVYPEFKFLELCMELCGTYALVPESEHGFITRDRQLASVESLQAFVKSIHKMQGLKKTAPAIKYLQNGSRSPMETKEYLLFCLPRKRGGYGLPKARLNHRIDLDSEEQIAAERKYFVCDMCWPKQKVVVEYDGDAEHSSREARSKDAMKKNILTAKGYTVFTVTGNEIKDPIKIKNLARDIARYLDYRLQKFPEYWSEQHIMLRQELFKRT